AGPGPAAVPSRSPGDATVAAGFHLDRTESAPTALEPAGWRLRDRRTGPGRRCDQENTGLPAPRGSPEGDPKRREAAAPGFLFTWVEDPRFSEPGSPSRARHRGTGAR